MAMELVNDVLVVDDSAVDRQLATRLIEKQSYLSVAHAADGAEALSAIRLQRPDIVVTDLFMPGMDGLELVRALRKECPGLPVVLMEALARGRPVITTYIAGIPELVQHGLSGWLVPAGSSEDAADAMRAALDAPIARLDEMGRVGHERVKQLHDVERSARELSELFSRYGRAQNA